MSEKKRKPKFDLFGEELAGIVRNCDFVRINYLGLMEWEFEYQMTDSAGINSYYIGEKELRYLEAWYKEVCEERGITFDSITNEGVI